MKRVGLYLRVSTEEQARVADGSLVSQRKRLEEYVEGQNRREANWGSIVDVYCERVGGIKRMLSSRLVRGGQKPHACLNPHRAGAGRNADALYRSRILPRCHLWALDAVSRFAARLKIPAEAVSQSKASWAGSLAGAMSGGLSGRPRWTRIFWIAESSRIAATGLKFSLPQFGQWSMSMANTRARSSAQPMRRVFLVSASASVGASAAVVELLGCAVPTRSPGEENAASARDKSAGAAG